MQSLRTSAAVLIAALYFFMGFKGLFDPAGVGSIFGMEDLTGAVRNEFRAVYGGFGVAFAGLLLYAWFVLVGERRSAILLCLSILTFGMAAGRVVSFAMEQPGNSYPMIFLVTEILLGAAMFWLSRMPRE